MYIYIYAHQIYSIIFKDEVDVMTVRFIIISNYVTGKRAQKQNGEAPSQLRSLKNKEQYTSYKYSSSSGDGQHNIE